MAVIRAIDGWYYSQSVFCIPENSTLPPLKNDPPDAYYIGAGLVVSLSGVRPDLKKRAEALVSMGLPSYEIDIRDIYE